MAEAQALIVPYRDGPYLVRGAVALRDQSGREIESDRAVIALCRCGKSRLRPFCDGSHHLVRFRAPSGRELRGADPAPGAASTGSGESAPGTISSAPQDERTASGPVGHGTSAQVQPARSAPSGQAGSPPCGQARSAPSGQAGSPPCGQAASTPPRDDLAALEAEILALRERLLACAAETQQAAARRRLAGASELMAAACAAVRESQPAAGEESR